MHKRILLKISGESLMGSSNFGIDVSTINKISNEIKNVYKKKYQICLIIGGGNIFRGIKGASEGIDRSTSKGDIYKSILESLSFDTKNIINFVKKNSKIKIKKIICSGGSVKNKEWMKIKSNVLGENIYLDKRVENVSLGSAILAGLASNIYKDEDEAFRKIKESYQIIKKNPKRVKYYSKIYNRYISSINNFYKIN